jgi:hypothetical protein
MWYRRLGAVQGRDAESVSNPPLQLSGPATGSRGVLSLWPARQLNWGVRGTQGDCYDVEDAPKGTPPAMNWRFGLVVGVSVGFALPTSQGVQQALEPGLGHFGAVLVGIVAAAVVGGLVALLLAWLLPRGESGRK